CETTGLDSSQHAIIELAGAAFDLVDLKNTGQFWVGPIPWLPGRLWNGETFKWHNADPTRAQHLKDLNVNSGMLDPEPCKTVMTQFIDWVTAMGSNRELYFWSKPTTFDYAFFTSYCAELGLTNPFHYRRIIDMKSFMRGMSWLHGKDIPAE